MRLLCPWDFLGKITGVICVWKCNTICILILYPANKVFIVEFCRLLRVSFFFFSPPPEGGFKISYIVLCHPKQWQFYFIPIWIFKISFSSLIDMTRTSNTMLNKSGESGCPCLLPDFEENAISFFPPHWVWCWLDGPPGGSMVKNLPAMQETWV